MILALENELLTVGVQTLVSHRCVVADSIEMLHDCCAVLPPDLVVLSDNVDQERDIVEVAQDLRQRSEAVPLLIVGRALNGGTIRELLAAGMRGYIYWFDIRDGLLQKMVDEALTGQVALSPSAQSAFLTATHLRDELWQLTRQDKRVLWHLAEGWQVREIARVEGLNERQVYNIQRRLCRRFGADTTIHMVIRAAEEGFVKLVF